MSEPTCIENLREAVSPTKVGLIRFDPAAILDHIDTLTRERDEARRERNAAVEWQLETLARLFGGDRVARTDAEATP